MKAQNAETNKAFADIERDAKLREIAGEAAPAPTALAIFAKPLTKFDREFAAALIACHGHVGDAYRMVAQQELPEASELKEMRERAARLSLDEALAREYNDPDKHKDSIIAMLVDKALHAFEPAVQIAAAAQLARMMPGWIAPTRTEGKMVTATFADLVKEVAKRNHEPGAAAVITQK